MKKKLLILLQFNAECVHGSEWIAKRSKSERGEESEKVPINMKGKSHFLQRICVCVSRNTQEE